LPKSVATGEYNYSRFVPAEYDCDNFEGLAAGQQFGDAELHTLDGDAVKVPDFLDKPLVLETGSMTCPMYAKSVTPMQAYWERYPTLNFAVLYVREAHPGEKIPARRTIEEKIEAAKRTSQAYGEGRLILLDRVSGEAHRAFGNTPNSIYMLDTDGRIIFRSIRNNTRKLDDVLKLVADGGRIESADMKPVPPGLKGPRTLFFGGWIALWDFFRGLPELLGKHRRAGNL